MAQSIQSSMSDASPNKPEEEVMCRRAERKAFSKHTVIYLADAGSKPVRVIVSIEDFSPFGIGMTSDVFLERGQQFTMQLAPSTGPSADLLYTVAYCQPVPDGKFRIGAEFLCIAGHGESPAPAPKPEAETSMDRIRAAILG